MKKRPLYNLIFVGILVVIFFIPLYPTIKWFSLQESKREKAELKFESPEKYESLLPSEKQEIDNLKEMKNKALKLGLDLQGGMHIVLEANPAEFKNDEELSDAVQRALEIIRNRVDQFGVSEPLITRQGKTKIVVELPGEKDPERAERILNVQGKLEFKLVDDKLSEPQNFEDLKEGILKKDIVLPEDKEILFLWEKNQQTGVIEKRYPLVVNKEAALTGEYLADAKVVVGQMGEPVVAFSLKAEGGSIFYKVTSENKGKRLAIVLDGKIRSAPVIREALSDSGIIEGRFSIAEAKDLALILRAGAIPASLKIVEKRIIGPSLGSDSIKSGTKAALIGAIAVVVFMLIYYKFSGLIADITLFLNIYFLISVLIMLKYTLTLPGIAGIVLTIGMAVDANVLIFERIKEELRTGKSIITAVDTGFKKAFTAIFDANVTTLITTFVLSQFGTGPIKGFAVTLFIGLVANLFTAVFVARNIFDYIIMKFNLNKLSI
jgi:preprotein translocase subunit SecD